MQKGHKVHLLDYQEEDFNKDHLLAIHSNKEAFQIAYFLNKFSNSIFRRKEDIALNYKEASFSLFKWENSLIDIKTILFCNIHKHYLEQENLNKNTLFNLPLRNEVYLFPEFKQVDFFIKSDHLETIQLLFKSLNTWSAITMIYEIPSNKIKNRLNLIFD
jgi:hypothetical protein